MKNILFGDILVIYLPNMFSDILVIFTKWIPIKYRLDIYHTLKDVGPIDIKIPIIV